MATHSLCLPEALRMQRNIRPGEAKITVELTKKERGFWWWVTAILAPIGIFGGPIAMAEMFSDIIEWHGPINYVVHWWSEHVSLPFHQIFTWCARLVNIALPGWFGWVTDYLVLAALLFGSEVRAEILLRGGPGRWTFLGVISDYSIWPLLCLIQFAHVVVESLNVLFGVKFEAKVQLLSVAPFFVFLSLWGLNFLFS